MTLKDKSWISYNKNSFAHIIIINNIFEITVADND